MPAALVEEWERQSWLVLVLGVRWQELPDRDDAEQDGEAEDDRHQRIDVGREAEPHHCP